jgi:hypothetical protein
MALFDAGFILCAAFAVAVAAVSGFGIGSLLTPYLGMKTGIKLAVAAVSIPHFATTCARKRHRPVSSEQDAWGPSYHEWPAAESGGMRARNSYFAGP